MQRQRFTRTIKNVTKKTKLKSIIRFYNAIKIDNYKRGGKGKKKKKISKRIYRTSENIGIINVFLESVLSESFPHWESQSTSPPQEALQHCADLWPCCGGSSDSNLVLLLCVLASSEYSCQNQGVFSCGSSQGPFIYSTDTVCPADRVDLICCQYSWQEGLGSSSLATLPPGFHCGCISTAECGLSIGVCS